MPRLPPTRLALRRSGLLLAGLGLGLVAPSAHAGSVLDPGPLPQLERPAPASHLARRVIVISEDGLRPDIFSTMKLPWHEQLYQGGAYSFRARTIRTASTLPSHASMLSGVDVGQHGLTWNNWRPSRGYIKAPTIFEAATARGLKTAMFVGKHKLRHIAAPGMVDVFERPGYYCKKVADEALAHLLSEKPPLTFIHFSDPDEAGHAAGWESERYRTAVQQTDRCLGIVLDGLARSGLDRDTLVILSADHGGHKHTHSGSHLADRLIPWIARGPGVRPGHRILSAISTVDTAATVLYALGLPIDSAISGRPVTEIYEPR